MYILTTPAKNEERNLPLVADSILRQTLLPELWLIVDDGSSDNTPEIIKNLTDQYHWIKSVKLPPHPRDLTFHYSYVCKCGFDHSIDICQKQSLKYEYIGLLDADTVVEEAYFQKLIEEFNKDTQLGIASGHIENVPAGEVDWSKVRKEWPDDKLPRGSGRLWRKKCFFETGGYIIEPAPDSISNVKALLSNWKIAQFGSVLALQQRETFGAEGVWNGYRIVGYRAYYLNKHPLLALINIIYFSTRKPYYIGIAYGIGYLKGVVRRDKKIEDEQIREYFWKQRIREYLPHF